MAHPWAAALQPGNLRQDAVHDFLAGIIREKHLIISKPNRIHDLTSRRPIRGKRLIQLPRVRQDEVKPFVQRHWKTGRGGKCNFKQFVLRADEAAAVAANHLEEKNILRVPIGRVGNCQMQRFILQFAVLAR